MKEYHKIQTVFKRNPDTKFKTLLEGDFSLPEFEYLKDNEWVWTEKVDGTNIRVMWNYEQKTITFGGKTDNAQIPSFLVTKLNNMFMPIGTRNIFELLWKDCNVCLYGEGYGAKIQKGGGNYLPHQDFVLFDIKIGEWWLKREDIEEIAQQLLLSTIPIIDKGTFQEAVEYTRKGFNSKWGEFNAEGLVMRPTVELKTRSGGRIITKIKHKDFNPKPQ